MNFLLDLKRLIVSENELYSNDKSNIGFLLGVCSLIVFKVVSCGRLLRIYIDINGNKSAPCQSFLMLFLVTDFSYVLKNNSIYSTWGMRCELSWLIVYILMVYCHLNAANISILSGYNICKQWRGIISKLILFCI